MEKSVAEYLRIKNLHAIGGQLRDVYAQRAQRIHAADGDAVHALHHHHFGGTPVPVHFRYDQQAGIGKVALELAGAGGFAHQIQLVVQVFLEFFYHQTGFEPLAVLPPVFDQAGANIEQRDIMGDDAGDAGTQYFYRRLAPVRQHSKMHLCHRSTGYRRLVEATEHLGQFLFIDRFQQRDRLRGRERRHLVLQFGELIGEVGGHQVAPRREQLSELDENRTQIFQRETQSFRARRGCIAEK